MKLRPYQVAAVEGIRSHYRSGGKKVLLKMPTGAGKTRVMAEVLAGALSKGSHALCVMRGRKLVTQMSKTLKSFVPHGVIMASDADDQQIQVASIDTLFSRKLTPKADIILLDEVHLCLSPLFDWLVEQYPTAYILCVSATPFSSKSFEHLAEVILEPITVRELIDQGFLVPGRYYAPTEPDLSTVKKSGGDYTIKDLSEVMSQTRLIGPIVDTWKERGEGRPTLLFAVTVKHSKLLCEQFNAAGVPAEHLDANSNDDERDAAIERLERGEIKILCNVGILGTGVDIPCVSCIIMARPTLSYCLHIQLLGRGARPFPGKTDFLVLDHASNTIKHGFYETHRHATLSGKMPLVRVELHTCSACYACYENHLPSCPALLPSGEVCGAVRPPPKPKVSRKQDDEGGSLEELTADQLEKRQRYHWIRATAIAAAAKGYKPHFTFMKAKDRYGIQAAKEAWSIIKEVYGS